MKRALEFKSINQQNNNNSYPQKAIKTDKENNVNNNNSVGGIKPPSLPSPPPKRSSPPPGPPLSTSSNSTTPGLTSPPLHSHSYSAGIQPLRIKQQHSPTSNTNTPFTSPPPPPPPLPQQPLKQTPYRNSNSSNTSGSTITSSLNKPQTTSPIRQQAQTVSTKQQQSKKLVSGISNGISGYKSSSSSTIVNKSIGTSFYQSNSKKIDKIPVLNSSSKTNNCNNNNNNNIVKVNNFGVGKSNAVTIDNSFEILVDYNSQEFDISTSQFDYGIDLEAKDNNKQHYQLQPIKEEESDNQQHQQYQQQDEEEYDDPNNMDFDFKIASQYSLSFMEEVNCNIIANSDRSKNLENAFNNPNYTITNNNKPTTTTTTTTKTTTTNTTPTKPNYNNNYKKINNNNNEYKLLNFDSNLVSNDIEECCTKIFGIPKMVGTVYKRKGIKTLYGWQKECLSNRELLSGKNLVYSLPTSGGKTMVAEIILFRNLLIRNKKSMFIFPFVSIVNERVDAMADFSASLAFPVEGYYGCNGTSPVPPGKRLLLCTIEKANIIINQMIEDGRLMEIGCVVVDELHMIGDGERGELLEILISKLLFLSGGNIQIIGMSATIPNIENLKNWLRGGVYEGSFRPVPLTEHIKIGNQVFNKENQLIKKFSTQCNKDDSHTMELCLDVIPDHSVLIFCSSKVLTMDIANRLADKFPQRIKDDKRDEREILIQLLESSNGCKVDESLKKMILSGVAYHNADLTGDEREIVERGFKERSLVVLCATSTLSTGVNLPARRVILRSPNMGNKIIDNRTYRQMVGRAGRAGIDDFGESFLMCDLVNRNTENAKKLLTSPMEPLLSGIRSAESFQRIVLDAICCGIASTKYSLLGFITYTYYSTHLIPDKGVTPYVHVGNLVSTAIKFLLDNDYIQIDTGDGKKKSTIPPAGNGNGNALLNNETIIGIDGKPIEDSIRYEFTPFGYACFRSCLGITRSKFMFQQLKLNQSGPIIISEQLHMCFIITPINNLPDIPNLSVYRDLLENLKGPKAQVAKIIGVETEFVDAKLQSLYMPSAGEELRHKRFFSAMILNDLVHESPLHLVASKYKINRGTIQSLMTNAASFAWMVSLFCKKLGYDELDALVSLYTQRLDKGVRHEIVPLIEINGVKQSRARALWNAGYKTVKSIALATPAELSANVKLGKFNTENVASIIIREAGKLLEKKSEELRAKAEDLVEELKSLKKQ